jgi:hypothetical protein
MQELNRQTLEQAIRQLPQYQAPSWLWERIDVELAQEERLDAAIADLPVHQAPAMIWDKIEDELVQEERLDVAIADLPVYQAPAMIWENIEAELDQPVVQKPHHLRVIYRWSAAAAVLLLLTVAWNWQRQLDPPARVRMAYSSEKIKAQDLPKLESLNDESELAEVQSEYARFCKWTNTDCSLNDELSELNTAKAELLKVIKTYGPDQDLVLQINRIEDDRSRVVKRMVETML